MGRELAAMPAECNRQSKRGRLSGRVACAAASAWLAGLARFASCAVIVRALYAPIRSKPVMAERS
jgi:hypothetical protein